jgi:hypothetical protein
MRHELVGDAHQGSGRKPSTTSSCRARWRRESDVVVGPVSVWVCPRRNATAVRTRASACTRSAALSRAARGGRSPRPATRRGSGTWVEPGRGRVEGADVGSRSVRIDSDQRAQEAARRRARVETHEAGWTRRREHGHGGEESHDEGAGAARRDHRASARRVAGGAASPPAADGGTR